MGKIVIIFGVDMSSVHINNENKGILILDDEATQGFDDTTLTAEVIYTINFTKPKKRFLSLHYNGSNSFLFVNVSNISVEGQSLWNKRLCSV